MEIEHLDEEMNNQQSTTSALNSTDTTSLNFEKSEENEKKTDLIKKSKDTVFGNEISKMQPIKIGNSFAFLYVKNQPLIVIGPHCKFII
jgi:hypothetical protein